MNNTGGDMTDEELRLKIAEDIKEIKDALLGTFSTKGLVSRVRALETVNKVLGTITLAVVIDMARRLFM